MGGDRGGGCCGWGDGVSGTSEVSGLICVCGVGGMHG